jgi:hypothetical protein
MWCFVRKKLKLANEKREEAEQALGAPRHHLPNKILRRHPFSGLSFILAAVSVNEVKQRYGEYGRNDSDRISLPAQKA